MAPAGMQTSYQECMIFDMLRSQTVSQVAGAFDQNFWVVDVLRATQVYPAVWHASLALAATHRRIQAAAMKTSQASIGAEQKYHTFALIQYNSAIKHLIRLASQPNPSQADQEAVLLASLLFMGLCNLSGHTNEAIDHAHNGLRLFYQWRYWERSGRFPLRECVLTPTSLISAFTYLECQFINRLGHMDQHSWRVQGRDVPASDATFTSLTDAYFEFQPLLTALMDEIKPRTTPVKIFGPPENTKLRYKHPFHLWEAKFESFRQSHTHTDDEIEAALLLEMYQTITNIHINLDLSTEQMAFDKFKPAFKKAIDLLQELYERMTRRLKQQDRGLPRYSFAPSICELIDYIGLGCRDGILRRRVIGLARIWSQKAGMLDPKTLGAVCEAGMTLEENGSREEGAELLDGCICVPGVMICNEHRICFRTIDFMGDGRAKVTMTTVGDVKLGRMGKTVVI